MFNKNAEIKNTCNNKKKVIIIDDEAIITFTLRSAINWSKYNFEVVEDYKSPILALDYLKNNYVDLIITDIKMPTMSGIEFIKKINVLKKDDDIKINRIKHTKIIVLSGYNEFELVRESFKLGVSDYVVKADLVNGIEEILKSLSKETTNLQEVCNSDIKDLYKTVIEDNNFDNKSNEYIHITTLFEIEDYLKERLRFEDDLIEKLEKPMIELAMQVLRVKKNTTFYSLSPSRYILSQYIIDDETNQNYKTDVVVLVKRLQRNWSNFININVSASICLNNIENNFKCNDYLLKVCLLKGKTTVATEWEYGTFMDLFLERTEKYAVLVNSIYSTDKGVLEEEKSRLFAEISNIEVKKAKIEILVIILLLGLKFKEFGDDFFALFQEEINYFSKIERLETVRELELWCNNYFTWVIRYITNHNDNKAEDIMYNAQSFINDNYGNPELTLSKVAEFVNLSEKYFSTRFTKEFNVTFSTYLTDVRINKAQMFLKTTDLKIYEISYRVGYNNVEHFNRTFKKQVGVSPNTFKSQI